MYQIQHLQRVIDSLEQLLESKHQAENLRNGISKGKLAWLSLVDQIKKAKDGYGDIEKVAEALAKDDSGLSKLARDLEGAIRHVSGIKKDLDKLQNTLSGLHGGKIEEKGIGSRIKELRKQIVEAENVGRPAKSLQGAAIATEASVEQAQDTRISLNNDQQRPNPNGDGETTAPEEIQGSLDDVEIVKVVKIKRKGEVRDRPRPSAERTPRKPRSADLSPYRFSPSTSMKKSLQRIEQARIELDDRTKRSRDRYTDIHGRSTPSDRGMTIDIPMSGRT